MQETAKHYQAAEGSLIGKTILITGASDGIGKALAIRCAGLGATTLLLGRSVKKLEAVYDEIEANGGPRPSIIAMDLETATGEAYSSLAQSIADEHTEIHGLVHNAGILGELTPFEHYDLTLWQKVMHVNLTAAIALTQVVLPFLKKAEHSSIVFSSSSVGRKGRAYWGAYSVSKFATEGFSQVLADENRKTGVRVNCVNPGATRTAMRLKAYPGEDRDKLALPDDVLPSYLFLLSDESIGTSGQSLDAQ